MTVRGGGGGDGDHYHRTVFFFLYYGDLPESIFHANALINGAERKKRRFVALDAGETNHGRC